MDLTGSRAAVFDLDGTLVDTEKASGEAWRRLFLAHGVPPDDAMIRGFVGRRGADVLSGLHHLFPGTTVDELLTEVHTYFDHSAPPRFLPGARELLHAVTSAGVPLALVTSGRRRYAAEVLDRLEIRDLFDAFVTAEDVTKGKPDPQGYATGCARLGVAPREAVGFEDAPAGVAAVRAAGMTCVAVATTHEPDQLAHADVVVGDLTDVDWPHATAFDPETRRKCGTTSNHG